MANWEIVEKHNSPPKGMQQQQEAPTSNWEVVQNQPSPTRSYDPNETMSQALLRAPYRMGEDALTSLYNTYNAIPQAYEQAKTAFPDFYRQLLNDPKAMGMQGIAGLAEAGHNLAKKPFQLSNYASERLNLIPQDINQKIQQYKPEHEAIINSVFGAPQNPGQKLARGITSNIPGMVTSAKLASIMNPMNLTAKNIAKDVIQTGERVNQTYNKRYHSTFEKAQNTGFDNMHTVPSRMPVRTIIKYTPDRYIEGLIDFARNPNNKTAHFARSDLLALKRALGENKTLSTVAERKQLKAIDKTINLLEENMFKNAQGHIDSSLRNKYKTISKGYEQEALPYKNPIIKDYQRKKKTADELMQSLSKGEFRAKRGTNHPQFFLRENIPGLGALLGGAGAVGVGYGAGLYGGAKNNYQQ